MSIENVLYRAHAEATGGREAAPWRRKVDLT
jgi:hypothetical protein